MLPKKISPKPFVFVFAKNVNPNISIFIFGPENCICHTLVQTKNGDMCQLWAFLKVG